MGGIVFGIVIVLLLWLFSRKDLRERLFLLAGSRFGKGEINIAIQKTNYAPGDTISGDVTLLLKKPVEVSEPSISLIGEQWVTSREKQSGWGIGGYSRSSSTQTKRERVYEFKQELDSEKECRHGRRYHFEIKIPTDILGERPQTPRAFSFPVKWYLLARLDIPGGLDISKKVDITIG